MVPSPTGIPSGRSSMSEACASRIGDVDPGELGPRHRRHLDAREVPVRRARKLRDPAPRLPRSGSVSFLSCACTESFHCTPASEKRSGPSRRGVGAVGTSTTAPGRSAPRNSSRAKSSSSSIPVCRRIAWRNGLPCGKEVIEPGQQDPGALQVARQAILEDLPEHGVCRVREPGGVEREAVLPLVQALEEPDARAPEEDVERAHAGSAHPRAGSAGRAPGASPR